MLLSLESFYISPNLNANPNPDPEQSDLTPTFGRDQHSNSILLIDLYILTQPNPPFFSKIWRIFDQSKSIDTSNPCRDDVHD